ncbi:MAG: hypothetical protein ACLFTH_04680 [Candidatus Woesearchaeota archaeon]
MGRQEASVVVHKNQDVVYKALSHPWKYHYYVDRQCSLSFADSRLHSYLMEMFESCPHDKFLDGPRSSALKIDPQIELIPVKHHEVCSFAQRGLMWGMQGTAHGNVQLFMLQHDSGTIGVEVPIWLDDEEYEKLGFSFDDKGPLSGHIDVLRVENGLIWIWDFKPKAHREKFAHAQVMVYAMMLSYRTGIPLSEFRCGYFDENISYVFEPRSSPLASALISIQGK